jgi:hypothetical protein
MAILLALLVIGMLAYFGDSRNSAATKWFTVKDAGVVLGCIIFVLPFAPLVKGNNGMEHIAQLGGVQVVDSVVQYGSIVTYSKEQSLKQDYVVGRYYPSGFHIAASFVEHTVVGNIKNLSWKANATLYLFNYLLFGALLCAILIYFAYTVLLSFGVNLSDVVAALTTAFAIAAVVAIQHLWLFVALGFLNYFYICATVLAGACYALGERAAYDPKKDLITNARQFSWPVTAFLLLGFGAAFSWPLLAPVALLSAFLLMLPIKLGIIRRHPVSYILVSLPIVFVAALHLIAVYLQSIYMNNDQLVTMGGALHNFNILFLLIGLGAAAVVIGKNIGGIGNSLVIVLLPYVLLVIGLMALHFFTLGEARYYLIKSAMLLDLFLLSLLVAYAVYAFRGRELHSLVRLFWVPALVIFIVLATTGTVAQPLQEVRGLFRNQSGLGKPPFLDSDAKAVTYLGASNKLDDFNMTILHYDGAGDRLYAHIETALWAHSMSKYKVDTVSSIAGSKAQSCFGKQFALLAYGTGASGEQDRLVRAVNDCAALATQGGRQYYIVSDEGSAQAIKSKFGDAIKIVY